MIYPNALAANFSNWILYISEQKTTAPQKIIVNQILSAALTGASVSDQQWHNFNLFTAWRFKFYQEWQAMQPSNPLPSTNIFLNDYLQRLATAGAVAPSVPMLNRINFALDYAQANGFINEIDLLFCWIVDDISQALIPIINVQNITPVWHGSFVNYIGEGIKGNPSADYLDTDYVPLSGGYKMQALSGTLFASSKSTAACNGMLTGLYRNGSIKCYVEPYENDHRTYISYGTNDSEYSQNYSRGESCAVQKTTTGVYSPSVNGSIESPVSGGDPSYYNESIFAFCARIQGNPSAFCNTSLSSLCLGSGNIPLDRLNTFISLLTNVN